MSGVDVRVIIPGKGDRGISFHGSNAYVKTMIEAGAKMYAYADDSLFMPKQCLWTEHVRLLELPILTCVVLD